MFCFFTFVFVLIIMNLVINKDLKPNFNTLFFLLESYSVGSSYDPSSRIFQ